MSTTVSSYQDPFLLHLHPTISHVCNTASGHFPCLKQLHLTNSHICTLVAYKHACLIHLHRTSVPICHSNIQPFVLSVALATDQGSRNGCYNCTGQAGPYQPAVKMATNICSMQISLNIFYCQNIYSNGVGSQVLTTLVSTLPLHSIYTH